MSDKKNTEKRSLLEEINHKIYGQKKPYSPKFYNDKNENCMILQKLMTHEETDNDDDEIENSETPCCRIS